MIPHSRPWITQSDALAVQEQIASRMLAKGASNAMFAREIAEYTGYKHAILTCSGTAALALILRTLGVGHGDSVILPSYVCKSVMQGVLQVGADPVVCDASGSWVSTVKDVARVMTKKVKAIILVHLFGIDASDPEFRQSGVPVIDDLCQGFGLNIRHQVTRIAFSSFHATKCLTTGEGGVFLTDDLDIFHNASQIQSQCYPQLSDLQCSLGRSQLSRYNQFLERRNLIAEQYRDVLNRFDHFRPINKDVNSMYFRFPMKVDGDVELLTKQFHEKNVGVRRGVDELLHRKLRFDDVFFEGAVKNFNSTLSLPIHPSLSDSEISFVKEILQEIVGQ